MVRRVSSTLTWAPPSLCGLTEDPMCFDGGRRNDEVDEGLGLVCCARLSKRPN